MLAHRTLLLLAALFALAAASLAGIFGARTAAAQVPGAPAGIEFAPCNGDWECGSLTVPVDYDDPALGTIDIAVARLPAADPGQRIGVLMANPGGPGAGAIDFARGWARALDDRIRDRFDIVVFDPRGTGDSSPVACDDHLRDLFGADQSPDTAAEFDTLLGLARDYAAACRERYGAFLAHLGTPNVVRDMDRIREALGEEQLSFVGYSYGTRIGAVYADRFPGRVRAFVLDGAVDNAIPGDEATLQQAVGFERALRNFAADCAERDCDLAEDGDPYDAIARLLASAEEEPIPAPGASRPAGPGEVVLGIIAALYDRLTWSLLRSGIADALDGDGSTLVNLADAYLVSASTAVLYAVNCADSPSAGEPIGTFAEYQAELPRFAAASPMFGPTVVVDYCPYWDGATEPVGVPDAAGAPPIVVIGTTGDPATPYEWSVALAGQLESGVLVRHEGEGHTVYGGRDGCIDDLVNAYLLDPANAVPADGATCGDDGSGDLAPAPPATGGSTSEAGSRRTFLVIGAATILLLGAGFAVARMRRQR